MDRGSHSVAKIQSKNAKGIVTIMLVSVYMPTRNRVTLLDKAIDSVLSQTYSNIELVVVNDASSDDTENYLRRRSQTEPRLRYFSNSIPRGASASRNIAISRSRGEFVTGLDDDDQFVAHRIGAFVEYWNLLTSKGVQPACLYAQDICLSNGVRYQVTQKRSSVSFDELFEQNYIGSQIFAPKAHFIDAGLFDEQLPAWQDLECFMKVLAKFGRAHLLDMATYLYDDTPRSDRISSQERKIRDAYEILASKHPLKSKELFLQIFQYGNIKPTVGDCIKLLRWGRWPRGFRHIIWGA